MRNIYNERNKLLNDTLQNYFKRLKLFIFFNLKQICPNTKQIYKTKVSFILKIRYA